MLLLLSAAVCFDTINMRLYTSCACAVKHVVHAISAKIKIFFIALTFIFYTSNLLRLLFSIVVIPAFVVVCEPYIAF